jgi:hypothetical protein
LTTWTPQELVSNKAVRRYGYGAAGAGRLWRVVESQLAAATMRLTSSLAEQAQLEQLLEQSKPALPVARRELHYLLITPFRYRPREGSRFRAPLAPGVWYGAEAARTALAEKSYWRLRFLLDAPKLTKIGPVAHTLFQARVRGRAIDTMRPPLNRDRALWTARQDYSATQALAAAVREVKPEVELIRYESVRDAARGACVAVLTPNVFADPQPSQLESWYLAVDRERVRCAPSTGGAQALEFTAVELTGR